MKISFHNETISEKRFVRLSDLRQADSFVDLSTLPHYVKDSSRLSLVICTIYVHIFLSINSTIISTIT